MKILIISRATFPMQDPRAFRTAELSEQLSKMGHDVTLYTVQSSYDYTSYMQKTGIVVKPIRMKFATILGDCSRKPSFIDRVLAKLFRKWLYYPDIEFMFRMKKILQEENDVDLLITIAQPHSIHWGVGFAKSKFGKKFPKVWVADCGDPFCGNAVRKWPNYMSYFEKKWCRQVDYITVPTEVSKEGYFPDFRDKIRVIPQGFDFSKTPIVEYKKNSIPTFIFTGSIYPERSPQRFMDYLLTLDIDYKFLLYMRSPFNKKYETLSNGKIKYMIGYGRAEIIKVCSQADFLINVRNPTSVQTPSKLIDYGIAKRPILDISNNFKEQEEFTHFINGDYTNQLKIQDLDVYKIENVAASFISLAKTSLNYD